MNYLGPKVIGNFRTKTPSVSWRSRREGNNRKHLELIRQLPSCISGQSGPCDPHHLLNITKERGVGLRATDRWTVPLTREEHRLLHSQCASKTEEEWFMRYGLDVNCLALQLWHHSGDLRRMEDVVRRYLLSSMMKEKA